MSTIGQPPVVTVNVGNPAPISQAAPVTGSQAAAPVAPTPNPYANWSPKGQVYDYAWDAYQFNKFPLNMGGAKFWAAGPFRRQIATALSKITEDRLIAYYVRDQFMQIPAMQPDHARLLQMAYFQALQNDPSMRNMTAHQWLSRYMADGTLNDWVLRGPLLVQMSAIAIELGLHANYTPDVPNVDQVRQYAIGANNLQPITPPTAPTQVPNQP